MSQPLASVIDLADYRARKAAVERRAALSRRAAPMMWWWVPVWYYAMPTWRHPQAAAAGAR